MVVILLVVDVMAVVMVRRSVCSVVVMLMGLDRGVF